MTDSEERERTIKKIAQERKLILSTNFLFAHGFQPNRGWSALSSEEPLVIVKLGNIKQVMELKSPKCT